MTKLYLVHCGFYDSTLSDGIYESHVNFFVVAENFEEARKSAKELSDFKSRKMHVDGLQEIVVVGGYQIRLERDSNLSKFETQIYSHQHRELAQAKSI